MLFLITVLRSLSQNWVSPLSVPRLLDFLHVKILPIKVVAEKDFQSPSSTVLLRYTCLDIISTVDVISCAKLMLCLIFMGFRFTWMS